MVSSTTIIFTIASIVAAAALVSSAVIVSQSHKEPLPEVTVGEYQSYWKTGPNDNFEMVDVYYRPDNTFIQGLYFDPETQLFWEGSGMWKESKVRYLKLDPQTKKLNYVEDIPQFNMGSTIFGEGICPLNSEQIVVLTWQNNKVYILGQNDLKIEKELPLFKGAKEGWGVTQFPVEGKTSYGLYVSDGTEKIFKIDGNTFETLGYITVTDESGRVVTELNELEYANGLIWANIWFKNDIIAIDPTSGKVVKRYDMSSLRIAENEFQRKQGKVTMDVLNGIAYDPTDDTFLLTGKRWHLMFKVKLN
jgi:glutamine cyclotransferase